MMKATDRRELKIKDRNKMYNGLRNVRVFEAIG